MKKNVASQSVGAQMITTADGTDFTGAVTVVITIDNGTQSASGGTAPAHEGGGWHSYTPTQAETNGDHIAFTFSGTGAITTTVQVYTSFPQTGDSFVSIATAQSDLDILTGTNGVTLATSQPNYLIPTATQNADAVFEELTVNRTTVATFGKLWNDAAVSRADIESQLSDISVFQTSNIGTNGDALTALPTAQIVTALLTTQMTESYAANGVAPTLAQAQFALHQMLMQFGIAGTTYTVKKLDNTTSAFIVTLDDATSPTSAVRT